MNPNQHTTLLALLALTTANTLTADTHNNPIPQPSKTTISGYVETSAIWAFGEDGNNNFFGRTNDGAGYVDGFNMHVVQIKLENPPAETDWAAGYNVELWFGPDTKRLASNSLGIRSQDIGFKQAYAIMRAPIGNGLDIKIGQLNPLIGYESSAAPNNPNFGLSYGFYIEPGQHTGLQLEYQLTDQLHIIATLANSYQPNQNIDPTAPRSQRNNSKKAYMTLITYELPQQTGFLNGGKIYLCLVDNLSSNNGNRDKSNYYIGATLPTPIENLTIGIAYDYARRIGFSSIPTLPILTRHLTPYTTQHAIQQAQQTIQNTDTSKLNAWSLAAYLSYQLTPKTTLHTRIDYARFQSPTPTITVPTNPAPNAPKTNLTIPDLELLSLTGTLDLQLWQNTLTRLELRWDHSLNYDIYGATQNNNNPNNNNAITLALNAVYQF